MKMKKYLLLVFALITYTSIALFIGFKLNSTNKEEASFDDDTSKLKQTVNKNTLSMMLETEAGSGKYEMTTASSWPTDGYVFNSTLSKCENGGEVAWDSENNQVLMVGTASDRCYIYFDKYSTIKINSYTIEANSSNINITINAEDGTATIAKYFYSKDGGATYVESTSNTYTFSSLSTGTYSVKAYVQDANGKNSTVLSKSVEIKVTLASYIKSLYTGTQGSNNIYYHDSTLTNGAGDSSYRYAGASSSVNNYVCFGSDADTCPTDNLYRIIGVFGDQVKLIKSDYANSNLLGTDGDYYGSTTPDSSYYKGSMSSVNTYYWNYKATSSAVNLWSTSLLNKTNLNKNFITYLNSINTKWANMIATTTWKVGGNTWANVGSVVVKTAYQNEIKNPQPGSTSSTGETEYSAKIGLMYVSDYGYAASDSAWSTTLGSYNSSSVTAVNWMYMGVYEWTISRRADYSYYAFLVDTFGGVNYDDYVGDTGAVRPVFYLESSATYSDGTGEKTNPIRIN